MKCERNRINFPGKCGIYFFREKKVRFGCVKWVKGKVE